MLKTILITMLIVAICIALLSVKILFQKNGRFPNTHVSGSKAMRKRGIGCVQSQDREAQKVNPHAIAEGGVQKQKQKKQLITKRQKPL